MKRNVKVMLLILIISYAIVGCSNKNPVESYDVLIQGKWALKAQYSRGGANENISLCVQKSTITFKNNNTLDFNHFEENVHNVCVSAESMKNVDYKIVGDVLEITHKITNNGQVEIEVTKMNVKFSNNYSKLELYEITHNGTNAAIPSKDVWEKVR